MKNSSENNTFPSQYSFEWAKENFVELCRYPGEYLLIHADLGVVTHGFQEQYVNKVSVIKRKVLRKCHLIVVDEMIRKINAEKQKAEDECRAWAKNWADKLEDANEPEWVGLTPVVTKTLSGTPMSYARMNNLKGTEVLMRLIILGFEGVHIYGELTEEMIKALDATTWRNVC